MNFVNLSFVDCLNYPFIILVFHDPHKNRIVVLVVEFNNSFFDKFFMMTVFSLEWYWSNTKKWIIIATEQPWKVSFISVQYRSMRILDIIEQLYVLSISRNGLPWKWDRSEYNLVVKSTI